MIGRSAALRRVLADAIDLLEQARDVTDEPLRQRLVREALEVLEEHRLTRKVTPSIGGLADQGDLDSAIELLRNLKKDPPKKKGRPKAKVFRKGCLGLVVPLGIVGVFMGLSLAGNDRSEAMRTLEQCPESLQALGSPVEVRWLAFPPGGGADTNANDTLARRAVPVAGSDATGRYTYLAEKTTGTWAVQHGALEVDGQHRMVVPCGGLVSESDARGRLQRGYEGTGRVRESVGSAPVQPDAQCTVVVHRDPDFPDVTYNCRVVVTCGGTVLYGTGSTGYIFCSVIDGAPATGLDASGSNSGQGEDPMLRLDLPAGEVQVSDDTGWSITIDVEPTAR